VYSSSQGCHTATGTHMPHSVTCHPAEVTFPPLITSPRSASYVDVNVTSPSHLLLSAVLQWMWIDRRPRLLQMRRAAIDRYPLPARPNPRLRRKMGQTDRQTDRQTDNRQLHRPCSASYPSSVNNSVNAKQAGLPWGRNFYPHIHTHGIPMGFPWDSHTPRQT